MADEPKKKRGRPPGPSVLTDEVMDTIVMALSQGCPVETAAALAGISRDTFYRWSREGARKEDPDDPLAIFSYTVKKAMAEFEQIALIRIQGAEEWQATAWLLERLHPKKYGRYRGDSADRAKQAKLDREKTRTEIELLKGRAQQSLGASAETTITVLLPDIGADPNEKTKE